MTFSISGVADDRDWFFGVDIESCDVHGSGAGHGEGDKILDLLQVPFFFFEELLDGPHFLLGAAREAGDEIRDEVLFFSCILAQLEEFFHECGEVAGGFAHPTKHFGVHMFGSDFHVSGDVVLDEFLHVFGSAQGDIHADSGLDEHMFHAGLFACAAEEIQAWLLLNSEVGADGRPETTWAVAFFAGVDMSVLGGVEIGGRAAEVRDCAFE